MIELVVLTAEALNLFYARKIFIRRLATSRFERLRE